jgi:hypothetical protein
VVNHEQITVRASDPGTANPGSLLGNSWVWGSGHVGAAAADDHRQLLPGLCLLSLGTSFRRARRVGKASKTPRPKAQNPMRCQGERAHYHGQAFMEGGITHYGMVTASPCSYETKLTSSSNWLLALSVFPFCRLIIDCITSAKRALWSLVEPSKSSNF